MYIWELLLKNSFLTLRPELWTYWSNIFKSLAFSIPAMRKLHCPRDCVRKLMCMTVFASELEKKLRVAFRLSFSPFLPFFSLITLPRARNLIKICFLRTYIFVFVNSIIRHTSYIMHTYTHTYTASNPKLAATRDDSRSAVFDVGESSSAVDRFDPQNTWLRLSILS